VSARRRGTASRRKGTLGELTLVRRRSRGLIKRGTPRRFAPVAIGVAILAGSVVFGILLEQVVLAQSAFKMERVRRQLSATHSANQELLLQATRLEAPRRIQTYAREELGMVEPQAVDYIVADIGSPTRRAVAPARRLVGVATTGPTVAASTQEGR
jgi:cell division protein FtsB